MDRRRGGRRQASRRLEERRLLLARRRRACAAARARRLRPHSTQVSSRPCRTLLPHRRGAAVGRTPALRSCRPRFAQHQSTRLPRLPSTPRRHDRARGARPRERRGYRPPVRHRPGRWCGRSQSIDPSARAPATCRRWRRSRAALRRRDERVPVTIDLGGRGGEMILRGGRADDEENEKAGQAGQAGKPERAG